MTDDGQRPPIRIATTDHHRIWSAVHTDAAELPVLRSVFDRIRETVGARPAESGGMLGGSRLDGVVRRFAFDEQAAITSATYSPSHHALTALLREQWNPHGDQLLGFVHSHPAGFRQPSGPDVDYARRFLDHNAALRRMLVPIVSSADPGPFGMSGFAVGRDRSGARPLPLRILDDPAEHAATHDAFDRVAGAYDLDRMDHARVVLVGVGGAAQFAEDLCRAGVGEVVLVDPDRVETANVATQQVCLDDVGRAKVDALADRLVRVSPSVTVVTVHDALDGLTDDDVERLTSDRLAGRPRPRVTLLCGFTDDFAAQARVARLGLHLGLPSIAAQVYREGRGAEVTFALPGVTAACQRCALGSRYRAHLDRGFRNDVGSAGTPIFATTRLNAVKGLVALALLHGAGAEPAAGPGAARWTRLLDRIAVNNLVVVRLDPDLTTTLGVDVVDRVLADADHRRIVCDETVWLPQEPENELTGFAPCGDCGGTGDLRDAAGTFHDTRLALLRHVS